MSSIGNNMSYVLLSSVYIYIYIFERVKNKQNENCNDQVKNYPSSVY